MQPVMSGPTPLGTPYRDDRLERVIQTQVPAYTEVHRLGDLPQPGDDRTYVYALSRPVTTHVLLTDDGLLDRVRDHFVGERPLAHLKEVAASRTVLLLVHWMRTAESIAPASWATPIAELRGFVGRAPQGTYLSGDATRMADVDRRRLAQAAAAAIVDPNRGLTSSAGLPGQSLGSQPIPRSASKPAALDKC